MTTTPSLSAEQMLTEIIKAQVKGGCDNWKTVLPTKRELALRTPKVMRSGWSLSLEFASLDHDSGDYDNPFTRYGIIEVLLEPQGLKAAYGTKTDDDGVEAYRSHHVAYLIVDAWLSRGPEAAIRTAYELLPC